jgi:hypothetical protein
MRNQLVVAVLLAVGLGISAFAARAAEGDKVTVRGILQEDKNGFFIKADDVIYDVRINEASKAEMHKFYTALDGDMVKVTGLLHVEEVADKKPYLVLFTNEIARLKGERPVAVVEQPVVVREVYVERPRSGIDVPFVHIGW